jgi:hypothetical protein
MNIPQIFEREIPMVLPRLAVIGATRGMLGLGAGLLLAEHLPAGQRRAVGWGLLIVGILSSIPLAAGVIDDLRKQ